MAFDPGVSRRAEVQEKQGDKIAPLASPHEIELVVRLMTAAHGGVAVDEGVDIHFRAIGLAVLEHPHSTQTVESMRRSRTCLACLCNTAAA